MSLCSHLAKKTHLNFVLSRSLESVYRKLSFRQKYRNPWTIVVSEPIAREISYEWFKARF